MVRRPDTVNYWEGRLSHWEVDEGRYFVTIHLAGAIPLAGRRRIKTISDELNRPVNRDVRLEIHRKIFRELEAWLDRAERITYLNDSRVATVVVEAIQHRIAEHVWNMIEYVVMPNHVHLFFEPLKGELKQVLESFKMWTGHQAGKKLRLKSERFWQKEWFDHWSRSDDEDEKIREYIRLNPVKAGLVASSIQWPYGSWSGVMPAKVIQEANFGHSSGPVGPPGPTI